jgi:hypothetical protein
MTGERCVFVGVHVGSEPGRNRKAFTFAVLDVRCTLQAMGLGDAKDVLAYLGGNTEAVVAVNAPQRVNQGIAAKMEASSQLFPLDLPPKKLNLRLVEHELRQQGIPAPKTPDREESCPRWMRLGFAFYTRLHEAGFLLYPAEQAERQWLETHCEMNFWHLLHKAPFDGRTLEGRLQRQLILYNEGIPVEEPMRVLEEITSHHLLRGVLPLDGLHTLMELNALAAALTAWLAVLHPERVEAVGAEEEGKITVVKG